MKLLYKQYDFIKFMRHKLKKLQKHKQRYKSRKRQKLKNRHIKGKGAVLDNRIKMPRRLFLESKAEEIFNFISRAEKIDNPIINFSQVEDIDIGSALYIKAFYNFLVKNHKNIKIECSPKNYKMRQILQHMGLFDYGLDITFPDIACWTVREWHTTEKVSFGKVLYEEILPTILEGKIASEEFWRIASSLQELLSNCTEHAYTEKDIFRDFYLIGGEYKTNREKSNVFSFCILDCGQGFKSSVTKTGLLNNIKDLFNLNSDSELLQAAVRGKFNASKKKNSGRGTGLPAVAKSVKLINGSMYVYSDNGSYAIKADGEERLRNRKYSAKGSIIEVILPINEEGII